MGMKRILILTTTPHSVYVPYVLLLLLLLLLFIIIIKRFLVVNILGISTDCLCFHAVGNDRRLT